MLVALIRVLIDVPEVSFLRLAQLQMQWMEPNKWGQWGDAILGASHVHCSQCMNRTIAWHIYRFMLNKQHMKSTLVAATAAVSAVLLLFSAQLLFACPEQSEAKLSQHWLGFYLCAFLQPSQRTQPAKFPSCPAAQLPKRHQAYSQCTQQSAPTTTTTVRATLVDCQQKESV